MEFQVFKFAQLLVSNELKYKTKAETFLLSIKITQLVTRHITFKDTALRKITLSSTFVICLLPYIIAVSYNLNVSTECLYKFFQPLSNWFRENQRCDLKRKDGIELVRVLVHVMFETDYIHKGNIEHLRKNVLFISTRSRKKRAWKNNP